MINGPELDTKVRLYRQKTLSDTKMHINSDKRPDYFFLKGFFRGVHKRSQGIFQEIRINKYFQIHFFMCHKFYKKLRTINWIIHTKSCYSIITRVSTGIVDFS